ncbi:discoidin domain-containing protein [Jidongwangia harbinensis]|uniref:discoidin domain-containing protein n=1 Tax=Jidongwangia harbinensis TaxID=2878561 RepID=UPI001CD9B03C|nr:discoidin domain-containing protein [Jidongwangia harbinensis]MCA2213254.1 discoidin domain-containing protein [Jidongwangia harbinensis]
MVPLSRRQFFALGGALGGALAAGPPAAGAATRRLPWSRPAADPVADAYHRLLHLHTRWVEQQWDPGIGAYRAADFRFTAVLGNAVLLTVEDYDAELAGVTRTVLRDRTLATIKRYAATNRLAGGTGWGRQLFWDSTFELYFILAARILWADLEDGTRNHVQAIATGQAAYAAGLGVGNDPLSGGWTPNGLAGAFTGDTKLEEMGVYAQAIAPGLAWGTGNDRVLRERFLQWMTNASALPAADRANPARVDGLPIRERSKAHNIHDTFIVENHDAAHPHYQAELWRTAGRVAIHFLAAGKPLPEVLTRQPNGRQLWDTLKLLASDAGEPVMPMVADRYHLYGRDVLPLAFLAQVQGDPDAARAEADLVARLEPYLRHAPAYRLTKFSGEEKYEPEARAELAIAYLFHRHRGTPTPPVSPAAFFAGAAGTRDFGPAVGLTVQQTPNAFAAAVTKSGFERLLWQPQHDNWLVDTRAAAFLPAGVHAPTATWTTTYQAERDGADATATVLAYGEEYAGYTTLPTGTVVYASSGLGVDEGGLTLFNLAMPGVPGLTGERTFASDASRLHLSGSGGGGGDGGIDELAFPPRQARYVRMLGRQAANQYGYSMWTISVLDADGADLAQGALATASSSDVTYPAYNATDGNPETRWAVDRTERGRADSWLAVDLGSTVTVSGVRLHWEAAYGTRYVVQTSTDAVIWTDAVTVPQAFALHGGWVDIDGRAGLVIRDTERPITVTATGVIAASGPAGPTTIEGYADRTVDLAAAAARRAPTAPDGLRVSDADGYLSVFNLTPEGFAGATVTLPGSRRLYLGTQVVQRDGMTWTVSQPAGTARVEPPRFTVDGFAPVGTRFQVTDSHHVTVTAPGDYAATVTLRSGPWSARIRVPAGRSRALTVPAGRPVTPTSDHARGRTTFPTSPLPVGMTSPGRAVDGDARTSWRPGPAGRMVVDLGRVRDLTAIRLTWTGGRRRPVRLERSTDGLTYTPVARLPKPGRVVAAPVRVSARYVAVVVDGWQAGDAELTECAVLG